MFNPYLVLLLPSARSPKPAKFLSNPSVYSLRNLTVSFLDLLCHCIVFKDRSSSFSRQRLIVYQSLNGLSTPFFNFFVYFYQHHM